MKNIMIAKRTLMIMCIAFMIQLSVANAQCSGGTQFGTLDPITTTFQFKTAIFAGEYQTFSAIASKTYEFSYCATDGGSSTFDTEITILDDTDVPMTNGYNNDFCGAQSHLFWTAPSTATYRVLTSEFNCLTNNIGSTLAYQEYIPVGIKETEYADNIIIKHNSSERLVNITGNFSSTSTQLHITNILGSLIRSEVIPSGSGRAISIDISSLKAGIYFLRLSNKTILKTEKIIVSH